MAPASCPFIIDVKRKGVVESSHIVNGLAVDKSGVVAAWGDVKAPTYPRSTLKPIQALPLIETGTAERAKLSASELSLACASHNAEEGHVSLARTWMTREGLTENDFECGGHWPYDKPSEHAMVLAGQKPCGLHNNCSGKHLGMLTCCVRNGWQTAGYTHPDHPLQQLIFKNYADLAEFPREKMVMGIDGCSAPNPALPMENVAVGFCNLMERDAGNRLLDAMGQHPFYVAGTGVFDTDLMIATRGAIVAKLGAEGTCVMFNRAKKSVIFLKAADGNLRSTYVAAGKALLDLGWLQNDDAVAKYTRPVVKNWRGIETGDISVRR